MIPRYIGHRCIVPYIQDVQIRNSCRCFCLHHPYVIVKLTLLYEHLRGVHVPPLSKEYVLKALDERRAAEVKVGKPGGGGGFPPETKVTGETGV